jgi:hypothetical protein
MRGTVRRAVISAVAAFAAVLGGAGCGGGEGGGTGSQQQIDAAREALAVVLLAATTDDLAKAKPHLALKEFAGVDGAVGLKPLEQRTPAEREDLARSCFNQAGTVVRQTTLKDRASIQAALAAGSARVFERTRTGEVTFAGPPAEGSGRPLKFHVKMVQGGDGTWGMVEIQPVFD